MDIFLDIFAGYVYMIFSAYSKIFLDIFVQKKSPKKKSEKIWLSDAVKTKKQSKKYPEKIQEKKLQKKLQKDIQNIFF